MSGPAEHRSIPLARAGRDRRVPALFRIALTAVLVFAACASRAALAQEPTGGEGAKKSSLHAPSSAVQFLKVEQKWPDLSQYNGYGVTSLKIEGVGKELAEPAESGMALAQKKKLGLQKPKFKQADMEKDLSRLHLLLAQNGFPMARLGATATPDEDNDEIKLVFKVDPGPEVRVHDLKLTGVPEPAQPGADKAIKPLRVGERYSDDKLQAAEDGVQAALRAVGYAFPELRVGIAIPDSNSVDLDMQVTSGERFTITSVVVEGAPPDLEPLTRQTVAFLDGKQFEPRVLQQASESLRALQVFGRIHITVEPIAPQELRAKVEVSTTHYRSLQVAVGTWTDDPIKATATWTHRDLFGHGRGFNVTGSFAAHDRALQTGVWWPGFFRARSQLELDLAYLVDDEKAFFLDSREATLAALFRSLGHTTWRLGVTASDNHVTRRTADFREIQRDEGKQLVFEVRWYRDTSDNPLTPTKGGRTTILGDVAPAILFTDSPFSEAEFTQTGYLALGRKAVLAGRFDVGMGWPWQGSGDLLPNRRFFAGGYNTMRGYRRHDLGPVDKDGNPVGGQALLLAGAEVRMPLTKLFGISVFTDSGKVWAKNAGLGVAGLQVASGGGIMVTTPIGPVRLEVAHLLTTPLPGNSRTLLQLGIGHPY